MSLICHVVVPESQRNFRRSEAALDADVSRDNYVDFTKVEKEGSKYGNRFDGPKGEQIAIAS